MSTHTPKAAVLCFFFLVASTGGCSYAGARILDFADIFRGRAGIGLGIGAEVYATQFMGAGFNLTVVPLRSNSIVLKKRGIEIEDFFSSFCWMVPPLCTIREINYYRDTKRQYQARAVTIAQGIEIIGGEYSKTARKRKVTLDNWNRDYDRGLFGVGFSVHALIVGFGVEVLLDELLDFILGWFTIDIMGDDIRPPRFQSRQRRPLRRR